MITVYRLKSDNFDCYVSAEAYKEITLQMSTGDYGSHRARAIEVTPDQLDKIMWHSSTRNARGQEVRRLGYIDIYESAESTDYQWAYYDGHGDCCIEDSL